MRDAAAQDKQMPYCMVVWDFFTGVEDDAGGIKQTADYKPLEQSWREAFKHGFDGNQGQPAHRHIYNDGYKLIFIKIHGFKYQAAHCHGPYERK